MASDIILIIIAVLVFLICGIFLLKLRSFEDKENFLWVMPYSALVVLMLFSIYVVISLMFFDVTQFTRATYFLLMFMFSVIAAILVNYMNERVKFSEMIDGNAPKITLPSKLKKGNSYLIKELHKKRIFHLFGKAIEGNFNGIAITRINPKNIVEKYGLRKAKVVWLTEIKNGKNLNPNDLEEISYTINTFISKNKNSIILFDGFEYLSDYNSFNKVLHLFQVLKDNISVKKAILLVYVNPKTFEKKELKMLESEFKSI